MRLAALLPSLRRTLAEITWIFVGITLALMFQNWNTDRERRRQELNLLTELYRDLDETRFDLERDIAADLNGLDNAKLMIGAFDDPAVTANQFAGAFVSGMFNGELFPKTSSYESIKTIGMDLIESDELRKAIADVYELSLVRVLKIQESADSYAQSYQDYARTLFALPGQVPFVSRAESQAVDFAFEEADAGGMVPVDFNAVRADRGFKIFLVQSFNVVAEEVARYRMLDGAITRAQGAIRVELEANGRHLFAQG